MIPAIISTLVYTSWSNRIGRKRVMILPMIGGTILTITLIMNSYFDHWPLELLLIGSFLDGCFGQFVAIIASIYSYAADVTTIEGRTKRTVILESIMFLGGVVSSAVGGLLLQKYGFLPTFLLVLAMFAFQMIYWCFLQESYPPRPDQPKISFCKILKGEALTGAIRVVFKKRSGNKRRTILLLYVVLLLFTSGEISFVVSSLVSQVRLYYFPHFFFCFMLNYKGVTMHFFTKKIPQDTPVL